MARNRRVLAVAIGAATAGAIGATAVGLTVTVNGMAVEVVGIGSLPPAAVDLCDATIDFRDGSIIFETEAGLVSINYLWPFTITEADPCSAYTAVALDSDGNEIVEDGRDVTYSNQALDGGGPFRLRLSGDAQAVRPAKIKVTGTP